ncbi:class I adenylate-forming enzyme family protein [Novosphingobium panipatense]|uniref:Fatty-acyl-CoA synthase n=1 Tax=Novosphingobium panipatense TaxID=428991 RepID=A0ABY1QKM1_9SPHN|nr:AMP-binding protein [Novosphingobium panipatense]SMP72108.1 fatty-acyl-CoA synthase [Novosphingobium panipatense]
MMEKAFAASVYDLFAMRAKAAPEALAIVDGEVRLSYAEMRARVDAVAADFAARRLARGERIAILSENRLEYTAVQLACAKLGLIAACLNWRLSDPEMRHCIELVDPSLLVASPRHMERAAGAANGRPLSAIDGLGASGDSASVAQPEDGLLIIYTSGTTGLPKAAVISHRAEVARMCAMRLDMGVAMSDAYISWAPMFHMGGTEHLLATLMCGGTGVIIDGFDADALVDALEEFSVGWLMLVPATIEPLLERLDARQAKVRGVKAVGCMADLVPSATIAAVTQALKAPYLNSFGATETGMPPLSADLIPVGATPSAFPKRLSLLCELRLLGADGNDVPDSETGEACVRGPTLFSGYWNADATNAECFAGGWFHMGDLFRRSPQGYDFVGRSKYLIKSGGENIYPAEIERVLFADARVNDAIVVRKLDPQWGEIPVAVIARNDPSLDEDGVMRMCREALAGYKRPKAVRFIAMDAFPRSASGKIIREEVEAMIW